MEVMYDNVVGGVRKIGIDCDTWKTAREWAAIQLHNYPPFIFGTAHRFKPCREGGVEVHLTRFDRA